jgi:hypothetical protein
MSADRNNGLNGADDDEIVFYLKNDMGVEVIRAIMEAKKKTPSEIDDFIENYEKTRKKIHRLMDRFIQKIETVYKYKYQDIPKIMEKGNKLAAKHGFSKLEQDIFGKYLLNYHGGKFRPAQDTREEKGNNKMASFLGINKHSYAKMLNITSADYPVITEISKLYDDSLMLHAAVRHNTIKYTDCAPEAILIEGKKYSHLGFDYIHPLIALLFISKNKWLERRMMYTNFGRIVVQRSQQYLRKNANIGDGLLKNELEEDFKLLQSISDDPNSLAYFSDESPIANLHKRFKIQVALWKNILSVRSGNVVKNTDGKPNEITEFISTLNSYNWTFFDSPELYTVNDEGTILRKLLSVFSYRPIKVMISPYINTNIVNDPTRQQFLYNNVRMEQFSMPIINVKLPIDNDQTRLLNPNMNEFQLKDSLTQSEWFVEHNVLAPKVKQVLSSDDIIFLYINRRYPSVNNIYYNKTSNNAYVQIPTPSTITVVNEWSVNIPDTLDLSNKIYHLKGGVELLPGFDGEENYVPGCRTFIIPDADIEGGDTTDVVVYNPIAVLNAVGTSTGKLDVQSPIGRRTLGDAKTTLSKRCVVLMYTLHPDNE